MCGRYTLFATLEQIVERFEVEEITADLPLNYNVTPSQLAYVVLKRNGQRRLDAFQWGLVPSWKPDASSPMINARSETLAEKPSFRQALLNRRCLIPASGFYEWQGKGKGKQPMYIQIPDEELFAFAGIWEEWRRPNGSILYSICIVTTEANKDIEGIHERMPVILKPEDEKIWLDEKVKSIPALLSLLRPYREDALSFYRVSFLVNTPAFNSPDCIKPCEEVAEISEQPSLF